MDRTSCILLVNSALLSAGCPSRTRSINSSSFNANAPLPGALPSTISCNFCSEGRPNSLNRPHVVSLPSVNEDVGLKSSLGIFWRCFEEGLKNVASMFLGERAESVILFGLHSGRVLILSTKTADTPVMKSSVTRLPPCGLASPSRN